MSQSTTLLLFQSCVVVVTYIFKSSLHLHDRFCGTQPEVCLALAGLLNPPGMKTLICHLVACSCLGPSLDGSRKLASSL